MKNLTTLLIALFFITDAFSQDKKPQTYSFGLGYGINFLSNAGSAPIQNLNLSVWMPKNFEITFPLTFSYGNNKSEQHDSTLQKTISGTRLVERNSFIEKKTFAFSISPGLNYHIPIKSNLDVYVGVSIPITFSTFLQNKQTEEYTGTNFLSKTTNTYKYKPTVTASGILSFGCNYFFYKNLALGAKASIVINIFQSSNANVTTTKTIENSGSDNYNQNYSSVTTSGKPTYYSTTQYIGLSGGAGFYLAYYFGMKGEKKVVKE